MDTSGCRLAILADFNAEPFAGYLGNLAGFPAVRVTSAPFGQVMQLLTDATHSFWRTPHEALLVWTRPEAVSSAYARLLDGEAVDAGAAAADAGAFAAAVRGMAARTAAVLVPNWVMPAWRQDLSLTAFRPNGAVRVLLQMNQVLAEELADVAAVHLLDTGRWVQLAGADAFNPKLWYMAKQWFGNALCRHAAAEVKGALAGLLGTARKMIVLDLDDTLWGGVVGEVGWQELRLGGHDPVGEAFADFQRALLALRRRGILLGIVSKNDEAVALAALDNHPEMRLRRGDFAAWRINWQDKARNLADLAAEVNLGLQSIVFIDDHPAERGRVRDALPEVLVPEWPEDKTSYVRTLAALNCFATPSVSSEDLTRHRMLREERGRTDLRQSLGSVEDWVASLGIVCQATRLQPANLERAVQLLNKTNQMNLSTRRLQAAELSAYAASPGHALWTVRVTDKFGDYGLTGLVSVADDGEEARLVDFVLSCRVLGRKVEESLLHMAAEYGRSRGRHRLLATCLPTAKNQPCRDFFQRSGLPVAADGVTYSWPLEKPYPLPPQIQLEWEVNHGTA